MVFLKDYVNDNKTELPTDFSSFEDDDGALIPPPAKRVKRASSTVSSSAESASASIVPILAAVAEQQLRQQTEVPKPPVLAAPNMMSNVLVVSGTPFLRMFEAPDQTCIVQFMKPGTTSIQIRGPDDQLFYNAKGTYAFVRLFRV